MSKCIFPLTQQFFNLSACIDGRNGFAITGTQQGQSFGGVFEQTLNLIGDSKPATLISQRGGTVFVLYNNQCHASSNITSLMNGKNGFKIVSGQQTSRILDLSDNIDFNGDGLTDIVLSSPSYGSGGAICVVFGSLSGFNLELNLDQLNGSDGFCINGPQGFGMYIRNAGDVDHDGYSDVLVSCESDTLYVIKGNNNTQLASYNLQTYMQNTANGFTISAATTAVTSIAGVGDVNADGIDDFIIGREGDNLCLVFGRKEGFPAVLDLSQLQADQGVVFKGNPGEQTGNTAYGNYDVNGDGIVDILITAPLANNGAGKGYVVYGSENLGGIFDLNQIDGKNGYVIEGVDPQKQIASLRGTKDMNMDGIDDLIIGTNIIIPGLVAEQYLLFKSQNQQASFNLTTLYNRDLTQGIIFTSVTVAPSTSGTYWSPINGGESLQGSNSGSLVIGAPYDGDAGTFYIINSFLDWLNPVCPVGGVLF